ncbi:hypothetical protein ABT052_04725 [Streptomyces sp. NPDC002766]|uniref:hypothetical protein n=1 Tax=Streptomyces sp. NPDC002766 TaxID=3154429 RepID=UPI003328B0E2
MPGRDTDPVVSLRKADRTLRHAEKLARRASEAHDAVEGANAAIAWREQVLELHDRGLTPQQIRAIMLLEDGGEGYERSNGRIDDILAEVPRRSS